MSLEFKSSSLFDGTLYCFRAKRTVFPLLCKMNIFNHQFAPIKVLWNIFEYLDESELTQCLLVSKTWNDLAQAFLKEDMHIRLCCDRQADLLKFPLFASKITKITIASDRPLYWISLLQHVKNLRVMYFEIPNPKFFLQRLHDYSTPLTKLQEINFAPFCEVDLNSNYLWSCLWNYRSSITKLAINQESSIFTRIKSVAECVALFPKLQELTLNSVNDVDLHELLLVGRNIKRLCFINVTLLFDGAASRLDSRLKLEDIGVFRGHIHFKALSFLSKLQNKLKRLELQTNRVVSEETQPKKELIDTLKYSPLARFNVLHITNDKIRYVKYRFHAQTKKN